MNDLRFRGLEHYLKVGNSWYRLRDAMEDHYKAGCTEPKCYQCEAVLRLRENDKTNFAEKN